MAVTKVHNWLRTVQGWILPPCCVRCGCSGRAPAIDLCAVCESELARNDPACSVCALPVSGNRRTCGACERKPRRFDSAFAPYLYDYPLDRLIQRFKYSRELDVGRVLAELGARALEASAIPRPQALVPVPLARAKLR